MAISKQAQGVLWIEWTHDAAAQYDEPEKPGDTKEVAMDMSVMSITYADRMLKAYMKKFGGGRGRDDDDDEPDDDDDLDD